MENLHWLGHDGFKITGEKVIYVDPYEISDGEPADIILITHDHYDHCSVKDILSIADEKTTILITPDSQSKLSDFPGEVKLVEPNKSYEVKGITIKTIPAYNIGKPFHPRENDWVGYVISANKQRIYHAGDTDHIPEMDKLKDIDVALVPVSGKYVMTAREAVQAVNTFKPKLAIPMHYGAIVGNRTDAEIFKRESKVPVEVLEKE